MSNKKYLFFDIDGTIWDFNNNIPESAKEAFQRLKENGHEIFICSGRSNSHIQNKELLDIGFDGIVSGCGARVEYRGEVLLDKIIPTELLAHSINTVREFGMRIILEGGDHLYLDLSEWDEDPYYKKLYRDMGEEILQICDNWNNWPDVCKFSCDTTNSDVEGCKKILGDDYTFIPHSPEVCEMVPKGLSKATGIKFVADYLNADISDCFAFGDSFNDKDMIEYAGVGIAMGNGADEIKAIADYVTTPMRQDGIYNACKHFGLI